MKIVETRQKVHTFGEVDVGEVFTSTSDCKVFMKIEKESKPYGLNLQSGYVYTFNTTETVVPLLNAELHLNK